MSSRHADPARPRTLLITTIGTWILTMRNTMITTLAEDYVPDGQGQGDYPAAGSCSITPRAMRSCLT